jgi:hypothetical protein
MVAVYDECDVIDILRKDGMSGSEAREYFDFNVAAAYVGEKTPIYLNRFPKQKVDN